MEGFVSKTTNSLQKVMMNQRITLLYKKEPTPNQNSGWIKGLLLYVPCVTLLHLYFLCPHFKKPQLKEREIPRVLKKSYESRGKGTSKQAEGHPCQNQYDSQLVICSEVVKNTTINMIFSCVTYSLELHHVAINIYYWCKCFTKWSC